MNSYIGGKYVPLKMVLFPSLAVFGAIVLLVMPTILFFKGVPFQNWLPAYTAISLWGVTMIGFFSIMAWVFCEVFASTFSRFFSALFFGLITPFVLISILTIVSFIGGNDFLADIGTSKGIENFLILSGCSFVLAVVIYWESTKNT